MFFNRSDARESPHQVRLSRAPVAFKVVVGSMIDSLRPMIIWFGFTRVI